MSLSIGITPPGLDPASLAFVRDAERVGATSVWVPETWIYDAFTPLGYLAATTETICLATGIAQLGARTPAVLAMSALALQDMSDGRFIQRSPDRRPRRGFRVDPIIRRVQGA